MDLDQLLADIDAVFNTPLKYGWTIKNNDAAVAFKRVQNDVETIRRDGLVVRPQPAQEEDN